MSKYTTEVRFICENVVGEVESKGYGSVNDIIDRAVPLVFNFDFPIFDEEYRAGLCRKILKHYYTREIGFETIGLWKMKLDSRMNEIMPYYNKLYMSELIKVNPLYTNELTRSGENNKNVENSGSENGTSEATNEGSTVRENLNAYSDTPSGALNGVISEDYLTSATKDSGTDTVSSTTTGKTSNSMSSRNKENADYVETVAGNVGVSQSKLLKEYRETFLNIDMRVIEDLSDLFMNLW